ncbi:MAG: bifunctional 5,10-methylenetetrahydrofolate dehydrogenase/5,10-methenyltetrahydrofolate cyclohydrolase [Candidatus Paceibacterota bacterium]
MTYLLDGLELQKKIAEDIKKRIENYPRPPKLVIFSSDPKPESLVYIKKKKEFGESLGCLVDHVSLNTSTAADSILNSIGDMGQDPSVDGVIIQLPFNSYARVSDVLDAVPPEKDVDGLSAANVAALNRGEKGLMPATARAVLEILDEYQIPTEAKKAVVIGRSILAGKPIAQVLLNRDATVCVCHKKTTDLQREARSSDILISAVGVPGLITSEMIHKEQVILDVGILSEDGHIKGDLVIDPDELNVRAYSPVPGGVGPVAVASLFLNLLDAFEMWQLSGQKE